MEISRELLDYRVMCHKIRQIHGLNNRRVHMYTVIADVDPDELENGKPICKTNKTEGAFPSVGRKLHFSMDGHEKLMGFQNSNYH